MSTTARRGKQAQRPAQPRWPVVLAAIVVLASVAVWAAGKGQPAKAPPAPDASLPAAQDSAPAPKADTVHITIQTVPPRKAQVKWGGKLVGVIPAPRPLVVERPRDSGPLDLVIRAAGFLPVHTRAYTFSDSRVAVKLTPPDEKSKLFGYREEPAPTLDAGAPPEPAVPLAPTP
jgi:hypothetical protein